MMEYFIEAVYLSKEGLGLYTKTFNPHAPEFNLIAGLIKAVFDFSTEMIEKRLVAIKFEDHDDHFASYLILELHYDLLLALLVRMKVGLIEEYEKKFRQKMKGCLLDIVHLGSSTLSDPIVDLSQYTFIESLVFSYFLQESFERVNPSDFQTALQTYRPSGIVVGLNKDWKNRYSFYKSDPTFLGLTTTISLDKIDLLYSHMDELNLFITLTDFSRFLSSSPSSTVDEVLPSSYIEVILFLLKKGILDGYGISI